MEFLDQKPGGVGMAESYSIFELFGKKSRYGLIYVVSSNDNVKYVGLADVQSAQARIARHIGGAFDRENPPRFSRILRKAHPEYFQWEVKLLKLSDARRLTGQKIGCLACAEKAVYKHYRDINQSPEGNARMPGKGCTCKRDSE
jgi:hypothetical protein